MGISSVLWSEISFYGDALANVISYHPARILPPRIDFKKCREEIAAALNNFGSHWCKRGYVEPSPLKDTYFDGMVNQIHLLELQLNKANSSDTEAPFLDLYLTISDGFFSSKIYDKRNDFDFDVVNFPFLDWVIPRATPYDGYISQLIRLL